ncbi:MAG: hypothetical protein ACREFO_00400 [Acetobacteraceae bacterium]
MARSVRATSRLASATTERGAPRGGHDERLPEAVEGNQTALEGDAAGKFAIEMELDEAGFTRHREIAVHPHPVHAELFGDLTLGLAFHVVEPSDAHAPMQLGIDRLEKIVAPGSDACCSRWWV